MPGAGGPLLMAAHVRTVQLPEADRRGLQRRARDKGAPARVVERARIVLLAADEVPGKQIAEMGLRRGHGGDLAGALRRAWPGRAGGPAAVGQALAAARGAARSG